MARIDKADFEDPAFSSATRGDTRQAAVVEKQLMTIAEPPLVIKMDNGQKLGPITVAYEVFGQMNAARDNVILVTHALTGDSHVAGKYHPSDQRLGWWDPMVGPGRPLDTDRFCVICSNCIGGCGGSTGPMSVDPNTNRVYAMRFPIVTIRDMVHVQYRALRHLGVQRLLTVVGGSMGGMQALEWAVSYPDFTDSSIPMATSAYLTPQQIAFNLVGRKAIMNDPHWHGGDYYARDKMPKEGLALARMMGMITYQSDASMREKFGRHIVGDDPQAILQQQEARFQVENYLHYQGDSLVDRFDANTYLIYSRAMDLHDIGRGYRSWQRALERIRGAMLVIGISSDMLFPTYQQKEMVQRVQDVGRAQAFYEEIESPYGHDGFLLEFEQIGPIISVFLEKVVASRQRAFIRKRPS
jgi:homoserine O-acetyltransferase